MSQYETVYRNAHPEELLALHESIEDLVPAAQTALLAEIERRGVNLDDVRQQDISASENIKRSKKRAFKKTLAFVGGASVAVFLLGAFRLQIGAIPYMMILAVAGYGAQWIFGKITHSKTLPPS